MIEKVLRNSMDTFLNGHKNIEKSEHWEFFLLRKYIEKKIEKLEYAPPPFLLVGIGGHLGRYLEFLKMLKGNQGPPGGFWKRTTWT